MASWHTPSCITPSVTVIEGVPHCQNCDSVASIHSLVAQQPSPSAAPQDELGEPMNLWWPPSVPYTGQSGARREATGKDPSGHQIPTPGAGGEKVAGQGGKRPDSSPPSSPHAKVVRPSPVYDSALAAEEIRLICLSAVGDGDSGDDDDNNFPLHVTLEAYRHDECPEYETTSYTWGGEDNDSTLCHPLFVGQSWDVLLLTKNCWEMLRYLRPWKGIRMIWVDAVCINQDDPMERAQQVAKMRFIYQNCMRVVVYLGGDLISKSRSKRHHPPRHSLHEFDQVMKGSRSVATSSTANTLQDLLRRRYFTRVWVIQELILSRNAVIPAADVEFWADNLTPRSLALSSDPHTWDWESTAAPWVQFMGAGSFDGDSLYDILRRTWQSNAADPRDKIFGILGLLKPRATDPSLADAASLVPNYQITARHAFIGFFAHILINLGVTGVLMNASGLSATSGYPSWMPDWHVQKKLHVEEVVNKRDQTQFYPTTARAEAARIEPSDCILNLAPLSLEMVRERHPDEFLDRASFRWERAQLKRPSEDSWAERRQREPDLYDRISWRRHASIDPSTGTLSIKLRHLFQFRSSPLPEKIPNMYEVRERHVAMYIVTQEGGPPLDTLVPPGRNHLFCLEKEDGDPGYLLLFLRELDSASSPPEKTFKLVLCCSFCDVFITCPARPHSWHGEPRSIDLRRSLHTIIDEMLRQAGGTKVLDGSAHEAWKSRNTPDEWAMHQMFPGPGVTLRSILPIFQAVLNESRGQKPRFEDAYIRCLKDMLPQRLPRLVVESDTVDSKDGNCVVWVEMTLTAQAWEEHKSWYDIYGRGMETIPWQWRFASPTTKDWFGKGSWRPCDTKHWAPRKANQAVAVRVQVSALAKHMKGSLFCRQLSSLSSVAGAAAATGSCSEDETTMLQRGPRVDDYFVALREWPKELVDAFSADGDFWQVHIV